MKLLLTQIRVDGGTQPRAALRADVIEDYAEQMRAGVEFPPLTVFFDGTQYWLADGFHRLAGALQAHPKSPLECDVRQGSLADAQWYSFSVNKTHGLRRTKEDKERAVKAALQHPKGSTTSDRELAEHVGVDHKTVAKYRTDLKLRSGGEIPHLTKRTGRDGKQYPAGQKKQDTRKKPRGKNGKPSRHMASRVQQPTRTPEPLAKMTTVTLPHNAEMAAKTLIEVFDAAYLRSLVDQLARHLDEIES